MLLTIVAWFYITTVSWLYGILTLKGLRFCFKKDQYNEPNVCITLLLGLTTITILASYLSLFIPLNNPIVHFSICGVALAIYIYYRPNINFKTLIVLHPLLQLLFFVSITLIMAMSSWHVTHPDTLGYHADIIKSIENNGLLIGYAQQQIRYGLQSNWFVCIALFSFNYFETSFLTFVNGVLLCWLIFFIINKLQNYVFYRSTTPAIAILWVLLLIFAFWDYTQVRLTATSASPDFIVCIYLWCIIYMYTQQKLSTPLLFLLFNLCVFSLTLKLSALPAAFLAIIIVIHFLLHKQTHLWKLFLMAVVLVAPFLIRNYYTSGYLLFPFPYITYGNPDWKVDKNLLIQNNDYIKVYARTRLQVSYSEAHQLAYIELKKWLPNWWRSQSFPQKMILVSAGCLFLSPLLYFRKLQLVACRQQIISIIILIVSIIGWFILAPDLRFGLGSLIPFIGLFLSNIFKIYAIHSLDRLYHSFALLFCLFVLTLYLSYRCFFYFDLINLLIPYGI